MIERLEVTLEKYQALEQELTKPEVLSDIKKTTQSKSKSATTQNLLNLKQNEFKIKSNRHKNSIQ